MEINVEMEIDLGVSQQFYQFVTLQFSGGYF